MGIEPVIMSAGELESERAGTVDSLLIPFPLFLLGLFASMLLVLWLFDILLLLLLFFYLQK